jgi:outer membrane protein TolC
MKKNDAGQQSTPQEPPKVKDDKKEDGAAIEAAQKEIDAAKANVEKTKDGDVEAAKIDARIIFKQAQQKKAKLQGNDELYQGLGNDIGELMKDKQGLKSKTETEPEDPVASLEKDIADFDKNIETEMATVAKLKKDLEQAKRDVSTGRGSDTEVLKIQKSLDDSNEDLAELKKRKADTKKKISSLQKESVTYLSESVADKFRYLMSERLK